MLSGDVDHALQTCGASGTASCADTTDAHGVVLVAADSVGSNVEHVVTLDGTQGTPITGDTRLDGLTITGGRADGNGGGLYCDGHGYGHACSPTLANLVFSGNRAGAGGALYNAGADGVSSPTLINVAFVGNAARLGGALVNDGRDLPIGIVSGTPPDIPPIVPSSVAARQTLAMSAASSDATTPVERAASTASSASVPPIVDTAPTPPPIYLTYESTNSPTLINVTFSGNTAEQCALMYNTADATGGNMGSGSSWPKLTNVIAWGNHSETGAPICNIGYWSMVTPTIKRGMIESADPLFVDAAAGDLRLLPGSLAINAGDATGAPTADLRGAARDANPDLGAYERRGSVALAVLSGSGKSAVPGASFADPLTVSVTSTSTPSDPLVGGRVTFSAPASGASASFVPNPATIVCTAPNSCTATTQATATANATSGGPYAVSASATGAMDPASFDLVNLAVLSINGVCGSAAGQAVSEAPSADLCRIGTATPVTADTTTYRWQCTSTGTPANCAAERRYRVTASVTPWGSVTPTEQLVAYQELAQVIFTPDPRCTIAPGFGTCGGSLDGLTYTTAPVTASCTVTALCQKIVNDSPSVTAFISAPAGTQIGADLQGRYSYIASIKTQFKNTGDSGAHYRWVSSEDSALATAGDNQSLGGGATHGKPQTYRVQAADRGQTVFYCVTPVTTLAGSSTTGAEVCSTGLTIDAEHLTWYVDLSAQGAQDGSAWADAFPALQDALTVSRAGDAVWVAAGLYRPDEGGGQGLGDPEASFVIPSGVAVYGGFAGTESTLEARDWRDHRAILSGDLDGDDQTDAAGVTEDCADVVGDNSRHVVQTFNVDATTLLNGFTITAGAADTNGGGWLNVDGNPNLTNLRFQGNCATVSGGALYNQDGSPTIANGLFSGNAAKTSGGAIGNAAVDTADTAEASPTLTNVSLIGNRAPQGAAINSAGLSGIRVSPKLTNVLLWGNAVARGQIFDESGRDIATTLDDSLLEGGRQGYVKDPKGTNAFVDGLRNLASDPGLLDAAHDDARPASADSPLLAAGDTLAATDLGLVTDLAGGPRVRGPEVDIGAYESAPLARTAGSTTIAGTDGDDLIAVERGITRVEAGPGDDIIGNASDGRR